jgi:phosphopantothenoylcysteine decarboxylase / phosphopantothenate---cysteine ligase
MGSASTIPVLEDRRLILGVTGSIAAYKAADLASRLTQAGALVDVILTPAAERFVTPLTFQSVTGRRAYTDADLWGPEAHVLHVMLGEGAEAMAIAPATAHTLARLATGQAETLLSIAALALRGPLLVAPAMDGGMFTHPATQANLDTLRARGVVVAGPAQGRMASGLSGPGRMLEPSELVGHLRRLLGREGPLAGRRVVVTAGGTQEPIDPVRMIVNRSSGKQGFAVAQAALDLGAAVRLISGPVALDTPVGAERVEVRTAREMAEAVQAAAGEADALVMAAAVADFQPAAQAAQKIKRGDGVPEIRLEPAPDVLALVAEGRRATGRPLAVVGFAAETQGLVANARAKLAAKQLSLIVANDVSAADAGFAVDTNRVVLIDADETVQELPLLSKAEVGRVVMDRVAAMLRREASLH